MRGFKPNVATLLWIALKRVLVEGRLLPRALVAAKAQGSGLNADLLLNS